MSSLVDDSVANRSLHAAPSFYKTRLSLYPDKRNPRLSRGPDAHAGVEPGQPLVRPMWLLELPVSNAEPFTRSMCGENKGVP
jgi:hypothetical protein